MKDGREEPPAVARDPNAVEMASVWIAAGGLHCSLKIGMYEDSPNIDERRAWGILLSDIARHVSNGLCEVYGLDKNEALSLIVKSFNEEVGEPSSAITGASMGP
jgi:hypothetical protein